MKLSEVTAVELKNYVRCYHDLDDSLFETILYSARAFIVAYTGKTLVELDDLEDVTMAMFILASEMYDNRMVHVESNKIGFVFKQLLDAHSTNLL